jgi:hypothetical protein
LQGIHVSSLARQCLDLLANAPVYVPGRGMMGARFGFKCVGSLNATKQAHHSK